MASTEEDFPRGGIEKKPAETKTLEERKEVDNLFQPHVQPETKKRKGGSKEDSTTAKKKKSASDPVTLNAPAKYVEILHLKNIKEGMLMLACVKEVADFDVVMSLPCGLLGFLQIKNISDGYTKLLSEQLRSQGTEEISSLDRVFRPGMLVRCVVLKLDITKGGALSIKLSINPKLLNKALRPGTLRPGMTLSGCVESVEDHGYLVDIGVGETKAFLPRQVATDQNPNPEELRAGQTITCRVDEVKGSGRVVRLSVNPLALARTFADASHDWSLTSLQPGLLVKAKVKTVTKHGLLLSFLSFSGQVDFLHMEPEEESTYTVGQEVQACVLYIEPVTRLVALSLRRHLLAPGSLVDLAPAGGDRIGEVVDGCRVTSMHNMSGALLELPDQTRAFVHKNHLKETAQTSALDKLLSLPELSCRILNFSAMEQVHFASLRKSVRDKVHFRFEDIQVGEVVMGTVSELLDHGMMVQLSGNLKGLVPKTHLSDIVLRNPEKKYSAGMKIKCRVLSVEVDKRRVTLTRKKALLTSTLPVVSSYAAARPGLVAHGFVVSIQSFGCIVRFYNEVKGLVPLRELSTEPLASPEEVFYVGQVVKVKVLECEPEKERLLLSFKAVVEGDTAGEGTAAPRVLMEVGQRCEARLVTKSAVCLEVAILPEEVPALLPTMHLSDHVSNCALLWEALEEGDVISNLVCLSRNKESITLTQKPLVRWGLEEGLFVKGFSDLAVGMTLVGWIKKLMPYGVFVEFPCGIMGLAPKSALCDRFVTDTASVYQLGQTVVAMVTTFDEEKQRFLVTLKGSEVTDPEGGAQALLLRGLRERRSAEEVLAGREGSGARQELLELTVGQKLTLAVEEAPEGGGATFKSDELTGVAIAASKPHVLGVTLTPGQKVTAVVLQVDLLSARVHVSVLPKLLAKKKSLEAGSLLAVMVQHVDQAFAVVAFESSARLAVVHAACHINAVFSEAGHLKPGSALSVTVTDPACAELRGLPLLRVEPGASRHPAPAPRAATTSESEASPGHTYGKTLEGAVRSVKPTCVLVALDGGGTGSVHVSQMADTVAIGSFPTALLEKGARVRARVIGGREGTSHRFLPFSHPNFKYSIPELTLVPSKLDDSVKINPVKPREKLGSFKAGQQITCFVSKYNTERKCLEVSTDPSLIGTVDLLDLVKDPKEASHPEKLYKSGMAVRATVVEASSKPYRFSLSLNGRQQLAVGVVTLGMVTNIEPGRGLLVRLPSDATGTVSMTQLTDCYRKDPLKAFSKDQVLRCFLLGTKNDKWELSLRQSRVAPDLAPAAKDPEVLSTDALKPGKLIRGYVMSAGDQGVLVRLSGSITGRALLHKATKFSVSPKVLSQHLPSSTLLTTSIISVDPETQLVELSLLTQDTQKSDVVPEALGLPLRPPEEQKGELAARMKGELAARMKRKAAMMETMAEIKSKKMKMKKQPVQETQSGPDVYFREGEEEEEEEERPKKVKAVVTVDKKKKKRKAKKGRPEDSDSGVEVSSREEETTTTKQVKPDPSGPARLQVSAGFSWDLGLSSLRPATADPRAQDGDSSAGEESEETDKPQKKSKQQQEQEQKEEEKALARREVQLMEPGLRPQDAASFERLLLASPNSSLLWLQYMANHLQATQIEQARSVAERALKTISFREEQEKLNVWVALLNLENMYGSEESLKKVFERAQTFCEPMPVYQQLADIYARSNKMKEAESLYRTMVKRFRQQKGSWLSYGGFLLQQGQSDAASALLQRALQSLPSTDSVELISKFAQLEYQYGDTERGRAMMDKILGTYPKRTDLWSVFMDLTIKHGSQKDVRALFDRAIHLSVAIKKVKFFFKRYLDYEKKHGTPESVQTVKEKALEFVEAKGTQAAR
ncbi:protein RRP5 homolog isoform X3 [Gadus morhua]|uniref:protein RRP5 homolog isoform X3 n=1 Tax=Gadus morhua TaxID=8049 RepID=UPI0011B3EE65|nr:protein RRP5 homolog isoform X3 [Gadus morhua]